MTVAVVALALLAATLGGGLIWAARALVKAIDGRRIAEVQQAEVAADLRVSDANAQAWQRASSRHAARADALGKVLNAVQTDLVVPGARSGVDVLLGALDFASNLAPPTGASGGDDPGPVVPRAPAPAPVADGAFAAPGGGDEGPVHGL